MLRHIGLVLLLLLSLRLNPKAGGDLDPINLALNAYGIIPYSTAQESLVIERFAISGASDQAIRESLREYGPRDLSNESRDAYTAWDIRWRWPVLNEKSAAIGELQTSCKVTVTLPDLKNYSELPKATQERWLKYLSMVVSHEKAHVDNAIEQCHKITPAIKAAFEADPKLTTEQANKIGNQFLRAAWRFDRRYDRLSDHGRKQGARF